jgi:hypothetical protein
VALLYSGAGGPRVRSTLAAYFTAGTLLSLAALALAGQVTGPALGAGALLLAPMLAGFALSGPPAACSTAAGCAPPSSGWPPRAPSRCWCAPRWADPPRRSGRRSRAADAGPARTAGPTAVAVGPAAVRCVNERLTQELSGRATTTGPGRCR